MELEKNKAIARRFSQVWGKGELDIIDELASPELSVYYPIYPQAIRGSESFKQHLTKFRTAFGDGNIQIVEEIAEGDKVVLRCIFSYTHQAEYRGIPASGKRITWTGIIIYRIIDDKVVEESGEEDSLGALRQLGCPEA